MNRSGPAKLTGALIVKKGDAAPTGYIMRPSSAPDAEARSLVPDLRRTGAGKGDKQQRIGITVRLDPGRHLRLRLGAAHLNRNLQEFMMEALDKYLDEIGDTEMYGSCACLVQTPRSQSR